MNVTAPNPKYESCDNSMRYADSDKVFRSSKKPPKYRGVFPVGKRFRVVMQLDGVRHNLGMHATELEAARAYDKFARENNKKTNFSYPPKQGPPKQSPTAPPGHPNHPTGVYGPYNDNEKQSASSAHFHHGENELMSGNPRTDDAITSVSAECFGQTQHLFVGTTCYGNERNSINDLSGQYLLHEYMESQNPQLWAQEQPLSQDRHWQQSYLQQQQLMYQQQLHDPYLMQMQIAQDSHLVVYIPVPLPISEAVAKYVNDYLRFEQQQRLQQQQMSQPLHPHNHHIPVSAAHLTPLFTEQSTPLSQFPAPRPATDSEAPVPVTEIRVPSFQLPEATGSVSISKPFTQES